MHQTNIEKMFLQFKEHQQQFIDVIFQNQLQNPNQSSDQITAELVKQLKMSFMSTEEIDRMKKESNFYK